MVGIYFDILSIDNEEEVDFFDLHFVIEAYCELLSSSSLYSPFCCKLKREIKILSKYVESLNIDHIVSKDSILNTNLAN